MAIPRRRRREADDADLRLEVSRWERGVWAVQRTGWVVMGALLLAGVSGVLGGGGLSRRTVQAEDGSYAFAYERVMRLDAPRSLAWTAPPRSGRVTIDWAGGDCIAFAAESGPPPDRVSMLGTSQRFEYLSSGDAAVSVTLSMRPQRVGRCGIRTRVNDGPWTARSIIVLP